MLTSHARLLSVQLVKQIDLCLQEVLASLESISAKPAPTLNKPVFILGAPRSGSTLLTQSIISAFDISYFSNLHALFYGYPGLINPLFSTLRAHNKITSYTSVYGKTKGLLAPSECGKYWYRFFRKTPSYVSLNDITYSQLESFHDSLLFLLAGSRTSFLIKNMYASLRLQPILKAFPDACFIVTRRNKLHNACSILNVRKKIYNDYNHWWSMQPPNYKELVSLNPSLQVLHQIDSIYATIVSDLELMSVNPRRVHYLDYENLCTDPNQEMANISHFFLSNNINCSLNGTLPSTFTLSNSTISSIPSDLLKTLKTHISYV